MSVLQNEMSNGSCQVARIMVLRLVSRAVYSFGRSREIFLGYKVIENL